MGGNVFATQTADRGLVASLREKFMQINLPQKTVKPTEKKKKV